MTVARGAPRQLLPPRLRSTVARAVQRGQELWSTVTGSAQRPAWNAPPPRPMPAGPADVSLITSAYNTEPAFLQELAASIGSQSLPCREWVVVDNGSTRADTVAALRELQRRGTARLVRVEGNLGILGGIRTALEAAAGEWVVPVDSDDVLSRHAVAHIVAAARAHPDAGLLFSDEDHLGNGVRSNPFRRPGWNPALALATSYVWHLCAFPRDLALERGVYGDARAEYCHDWDTLLRLLRAGRTPHHIPHVLYSWRTHESSTTHKADPHAGSLASQTAVLEDHLDFLGLRERFRVEPSPIDRGAPELRLGYVGPGPGHWVGVVVDTGLDIGTEPPEDMTHWWSPQGRPAPDGLQALPAPLAAMLAALVPQAEGGAVWFQGLGVSATEAGGRLPRCELWSWCELLEDAHMVGGRLLDGSSRVLTAGAFLDGTGGLVVPDAGRAAGDPGPMAMALKPRTVAAVDLRLCVLRGDAIPSLLDRLGNAPMGPDVDGDPGAELSAACWAAGGQVVFSPYSQGEGELTPVLVNQAGNVNHNWRSRFGPTAPSLPMGYC